MVGVTHCFLTTCWLPHNQHVLLFSCNPIDQLCLGDPGYSRRALIFDFPKETELLWLRGRWTKFQSHFISDFISERLSGKLIQRLSFHLASLTPSLFVTEFIFSWPFELDGVGGIALYDAITSFIKRCYGVARETGAQFLLQNSPSLARKRIIPNRSFPSYHKPLFQSEAKCEAFDMKIIFYSHAKASFWNWDYRLLKLEIMFIRWKKMGTARKTTSKHIGI